MKLRCVLVMFILLSAPRTVHAQSLLSLQFLPAVQQGAPGDTITFSAEATNLSSSALYLNAADVTMFGPATPLPVPDLTDFVLNFVFASPLSPNTSITDDILTVSIDPATTPGDYFGNLAVAGGTDPNALDPLVTQLFQITVVPEPSTIVSFGGFIAMGSLVALRKRKLHPIVRQIK